MALYQHEVNTFRKAVRAKRVRQLCLAIVSVIFVSGAIVGVDTLVQQSNQGQIMTSSETKTTVQSAHITVFQTPYFKFQADNRWHEVTDELNLIDQDSSTQYLFRKFEKEFIQHELWVTINAPVDHKPLRHNIPTRVMPVQIEPNGLLTQLEPVSSPCSEALNTDDRLLEPHTLMHNGVEYFCNPNADDFTVVVGIRGGTNRLSVMSSKTGQEFVATITYRNIKAIPDEHEIEEIMRTFQFI